MFGTFTVTVDGSAEVRHNVDTPHRPREIWHNPTAEDTVSEFSDDGPMHLPAPSARLAFPPSLDTSISPAFSSFSPSTSSGYSIPSPESVSTPFDPDDAWNLIPYNVSWGHEYEEYRAGILPGPEGDCIFLRSPTPLRNQRASEACKKCRERKAKCTGTRPSCARCTSRDYVCEYASEVAPEPTSATKARRPRRETREPARGPAMPPAFPDFAIKAEISEPLTLQYPDHTSPYWEGSTPSDEYPIDEPWQLHTGALADTAAHPLVGHSSIAAPQPVRHAHPQHLVAPLPEHDDAHPISGQDQALIQLPILPSFDVRSQHPVEQHEAYVQSEVKYENGVPYGSLHAYDPGAVYHVGQDYGISMQSFDFDQSGFPMHIAPAKPMYGGFASHQYVNYSPSS
ncbi:hypothetical protein BC834DRAFT_974588 [Gloeopeniophorella convolvens]|nr:hypothetical protein BC834DRAFT_974588 [Gloeopeniophorella convolvens]